MDKISDQLRPITHVVQVENLLNARIEMEIESPFQYVIQQDILIQELCSDIPPEKRIYHIIVGLREKWTNFFTKHKICGGIKIKTTRIDEQRFFMQKHQLFELKHTQNKLVETPFKQPTYQVEIGQNFLLISS